MPDPGYSGSLGAIPGGSRPSRIQTPEGSLMRSLIPYHPARKNFSKLEKNFGAYFTHFERIAKRTQKNSNIFSLRTCVRKKKAALLHSQSGSTALKTISAASFGRREAKFFDMMKRVIRKLV
jgi:hypothetical protein